LSAQEFPRIQKGRVDPGDGFLLDNHAWFVVAAGALAVLATDMDARTRTFTPEQLLKARRISSRFVILMQGVAAMKGSVLGYKLTPKGLPVPLRDWLLEELRELGTLIDGSIDELEEQEAEDEDDAAGDLV
jgi:hypothetical protein